VGTDTSSYSFEAFHVVALLWVLPSLFTIATGCVTPTGTAFTDTQNPETTDAAARHVSRAHAAASREARVDGLSAEIVAAPHGNERLALMRELATVAPSHPLISNTRMRIEHLHVAVAATNLGQYTRGEALLRSVTTGVESGTLSLDPEQRDLYLLTRARLARARGDRQLLDDTLLKFVVSDTSGRLQGRIEEALSILSESETDEASLAWLQRLTETLEDENRQSAKIYQFIAIFRAKHGADDESVWRVLQKMVDRGASGERHVTLVYGVLKRAGRVDLAIRLLELDADRHPGFPTTRRLFRALVEHDRSDDAEAVAREFAEANPSVETYQRIAKWHDRLGQKRAALRWLKQGRKRHPDSWLTLQRAFQLALELGEPEEVRPLERQIVKAAAEEQSKVEEIAAILASHQEQSRALELLWRAFRKNPRDGSLARKIARLEARRGQPQRAVDAIERSGRARNDTAKGWRLKARFVERLVGIEAALPLYARSSSKGERHDAIFYLAALQRAGKTQQLEREFARYIDRFTSADALRRLLVAIKFDELPKASRLAAIESMTESTGVFGFSVSRVTEHFAAQGHWDRALAYLEQAFAENPDGLRSQFVRHLESDRRAQILDGLRSALSDESAPVDELDDLAVRFRAEFHLVYHAYNWTRPGRDAPQSLLEDRRIAREYFVELVERAGDGDDFDLRLFSNLAFHDFHELAEQVLIAQYSPSRGAPYWESYVHILRQLGRDRAAGRLAEHLLTEIRPGERAVRAVQMARKSRAAGDLRSAEALLRKALACAERPELSDSLRNNMRAAATNDLAEILLERDRLHDYLALTDDFEQRFRAGDPLYAEPGSATAIEVLWRFGYRDAYLERVEKLVSLQPDSEWTKTLAYAHAEHHDVERAMELATQFSDDEQAVWRLADALAASSYPELALELLESYEQPSERPMTASHLALYAQIMMRRGRCGDAIAKFQRYEAGDDATSEAFRRITPKAWARLVDTAKRTRCSEPLSAILNSLPDVPLDQHALGDALEHRRDLSTVYDDWIEESASKNSRPFPKHFADAGLDWLLARYLGEELQIGRHSRERLHIWPHRDALIRLGQLTPFVDRVLGMPNPRPITEHHFSKYLLFDGRPAEVEMLAMQQPVNTPWQTQFAVERYQPVLQRVMRVRKDPNMRSVEFSNMHAYALLTGREEAFVDALVDTDNSATTARALRASDTFHRGEPYRQLKIAADELDNVDADNERVEELLFYLRVASVAGYGREVGALLGRVAQPHTLPENGRRLHLRLTETPPRIDDLGLLHRRDRESYLATLAETGHHERLASIFGTRLAHRARQAKHDRLAHLALTAAIRTGDWPRVRVLAEEFVRGLDFPSRDSHSDSTRALRAAHLDAYGESNYARLQGMRYGYGNLRAWYALLAAGRPDLARLDDQIRALERQHARAYGVPKLAFFPGVRPDGYYAESLARRHAAYPADGRIARTLILNQLTTAPIGRGRPALRKYVREHADQPAEIAAMVQVLVDHELDVELSRVVLPAVDATTLPVLTNLHLTRAAIRTGQIEDARRLARLVEPRLPEPAYVLADMANAAVDVGAMKLAAELLTRSEAASGADSTHYREFVRARIGIRKDAGKDSLTLAKRLLDQRKVAPGDHCRLLTDALQNERERLAVRLIEAMLRLPQANRPMHIPASNLKSVIDCAIERGVAKEALAVMQRRFPRQARGEYTASAPIITVRWSRLYRRAGHIRTADRLSERAVLAVDLLYGRPLLTPAILERARVLLAQDRPERALTILDRLFATSTTHRRRDALILAGRAHIQRGARDLGIRVLQIASVMHHDAHTRNRLRVELLGFPSPPIAPKNGAQ
jgi:predicted Zn-dependent protease